MKVICPHCKEKNDILNTNQLVTKATCIHCNKSFKRILPKKPLVAKTEKKIEEKESKLETPTEESRSRVKVIREESGVINTGNPGSLGINSGPVSLEYLASLGVPITKTW